MRHGRKPDGREWRGRRGLATRSARCCSGAAEVGEAATQSGSDRGDDRAGQEDTRMLKNKGAGGEVSPERPRKKLSFREPEIMGYYMQMKQNVASRLSRKGRNPKGAKGAESPLAAPDSSPLVKKTDSQEDIDLEVHYYCAFIGGLPDFRRL